MVKVSTKKIHFPAGEKIPYTLEQEDGKFIATLTYPPFTISVPVKEPLFVTRNEHWVFAELFFSEKQYDAAHHHQDVYGGINNALSFLSIQQLLEFSPYCFFCQKEYRNWSRFISKKDEYNARQAVHDTLEEILQTVRNS
ncbi:MAG: hypothetical protein Q4D62_10530 [Planctomycetia bacterium]|nr:hypothetical protein [Planctomycetia bacterium]